MPTNEWIDEAVCAQTDPEVFFPEKGQDPRPAKRVCTSCPVRAACLEDAVLSYDNFGVRGGMTAKQRARIRRERGMPAARSAERNERDAHILQLMARGMDALAIADQLNVDPVTVHRARRAGVA